MINPHSTPAASWCRLLALGGVVQACSAGPSPTTDGPVFAISPPSSAIAAPARPRIQLAEIEDAVQVGVGTSHACALRRSGEVVCWGNNEVGQLGAGDWAPHLGAGPVSGLSDAVSLSVSGDHTCAVRSTGELVCWGGQVPIRGDEVAPRLAAPATLQGVSDATAVSTERFHTCALTRAGKVLCLGANSFGALGDPDVPGDRGPVIVRGLDGAVALATSHFGGCAVRDNGTVLCWGSGAITAWAPGSAEDFHAPADSAADITPAPVPGITDAVDVNAWDLRACVIRRGGKAVCWNTESRSMIPSAPLPTGDMVSLAERQSSPDDLCVLRDGRLALLGPGSEGEASTAIPVLRDVTNATASAGSEYSGCAVVGKGSVTCWGGAEGAAP